MVSGCTVTRLLNECTLCVFVWRYHTHILSSQRTVYMMLTVCNHICICNLSIACRVQRSHRVHLYYDFMVRLLIGIFSLLDPEGRVTLRSCSGSHRCKFSLFFPQTLIMLDKLNIAMFSLVVFFFLRRHRILQSGSAVELLKCLVDYAMWHGLNIPFLKMTVTLCITIVSGTVR